MDSSIDPRLEEDIETLLDLLHALFPSYVSGYQPSPPSPPPPKELIYDVLCPICHSPNVDGETTIAYPECGHGTCKDCMSVCQNNSKLCPLCRQVMGEIREQVFKKAPNEA